MAGVRRHYQRDRLGSTRAVMEGSSVVESYDYSPWGLLLAGRALVSSAPTRELFTGQEFDASTQLYYFGARYYMPAIGRWMSVDPSADALPGWSAYNYVLNNPGSTTDPTGMFPIFGDGVFESGDKHVTNCAGLDSYACAARYGYTWLDDQDEVAKAYELGNLSYGPDMFTDLLGLPPETLEFADDYSARAVATCMATSLTCAVMAAVLHADENTYTVRLGTIGPGGIGGEYIGRYRFSADGNHVMELKGGDIVLDPSTFARGERMLGAPVSAAIVVGHELGHAFTDLLLQGAGKTEIHYYADEAPGLFFESLIRSEMGLPQRQR